jgi:segregation and condensation protein B
MNLEEIKRQIEVLIFVSDRPVSLRSLFKVIKKEPKEIKRALLELKAEYESRGFILCEIAGGYQFRTNPIYASLVKQFLEKVPPRLSRASIETLAIIAYEQPITRAKIETIRGVDSLSILKTLLKKRLIKICGRKKAPGLPLLYGTSSKFLELFGLKSLKELPSLSEFELTK